MPIIDMTDPKQRAEYLFATFGYTEPPKFPFQRPDTSDAFTLTAKKPFVIKATRPEEV